MGFVGRITLKARVAVQFNDPMNTPVQIGQNGLTNWLLEGYEHNGNCKIAFS
jgi:hypothetical protein